MWLLFALLAPLLWAIVYVLDAHCVRERLERSWMGATTSAFATVAVVVPLLPFVKPLGLKLPEWHVVATFVAAGAIFQLGQFLYFRCLDRSEAGVVAAYLNLIPALMPVAAFLALGRVLDLSQYAGIGVLVAASVAMCLLDANRSARLQSGTLILVTICIDVCAFLLVDVAYESADYFTGFLLMTIGIVIAGSAPLASAKVRALFRRSAPTLRKAVGIFLVVEVANVGALAASMKAFQLAGASLVVAVEATAPAFVFALSLFLWKIAPKYGDPLAARRLPWKMACVAVMVIGTLMLS